MTDNEMMTQIGEASMERKEDGGNCISMMDLPSPRRNEFHGGWKNELHAQ